jgi:hypothetical protein
MTKQLHKKNIFKITAIAMAAILLVSSGTSFAGGGTGGSGGGGGGSGGNTGGKGGGGGGNTQTQGQTRVINGQQTPVGGNYTGQTTINGRVYDSWSNGALRDVQTGGGGSGGSGGGRPRTCTNGATNPPTCTTCPSGQSIINGRCTTPCSNGATNAPTCTTCPSGQNLYNGSCVGRCTVCPSNQTLLNGVCTNRCPNGATNPPTCTTCPVNQALIGGICRPVCTNGAINPPLCNSCGTGFYLNSSNNCVANPCGNTTPPSNYGANCNSGTNACGQSTTGTIQCNGSCTTNTPNNNACITGFRSDTTSVTANGSVEFSWNLTNPAGVTCSFYDRSKPQAGSTLGTPIPGLQNLDSSINRIRINNIQRSTEFCLYCKYPSSPTPAASHQWVRVIRVGES